MTTGRDNLTSIRWTYADGRLTLHDHLDRATADAIGRIIDGLHERREEVLVTVGATTYRYRVPEEIDDTVVVKPPPTPTAIPVAVPSPSPRAPEPLTTDGRRHPAPHHCRKRRKARHAKH